MLQAGVDDSGKDGISPAFVLAGYLGSANDLMDLADRWEALLDKEPKLAYVKGYEAFGLHGQFYDWTVEQRDSRLLQFVQLIARYSGKGIAFIIDNKPFDLIKGLPDDNGVSFKDPYEFAYVLSLSTLLQVLPDFGESAVDVVFDRDLITRRQAARAYKRMFKERPSEITDRLFRKEPHWEDDQQFLPLQAADLLTYCVRATRDPNPLHDRVRQSPVIAALRSIPTPLAYAYEDRIRYLRERIQKGQPRESLFDTTRW